MSAVKSGFTIPDDPALHALREKNLVFARGYCGTQAFRSAVTFVPVFMTRGSHPICGGCVCSIEDEHRKARR